MWIYSLKIWLFEIDIFLSKKLSYSQYLAPFFCCSCGLFVKKIPKHTHTHLQIRAKCQNEKFVYFFFISFSLHYYVRVTLWIKCSTFLIHHCVVVVFFCFFCHEHSKKKSRNKFINTQLLNVVQQVNILFVGQVCLNDWKYFFVFFSVRVIYRFPFNRLSQYVIMAPKYLFV